MKPGEVYWMSEPEYVGAMPLRVELFSEPFNLFGAPKARGWIMTRKLWDLSTMTLHFELERVEGDDA